MATPSGEREMMQAKGREKSKAISVKALCLQVRDQTLTQRAVESHCRVLSKVVT